MLQGLIPSSIPLSKGALRSPAARLVPAGSPSCWPRACPSLVLATCMPHFQGHLSTLPGPQYIHPLYLALLFYLSLYPRLSH